MKELMLRIMLCVVIRDCKNSKILEGCFYKALDVKEEEEGGVHEELKGYVVREECLLWGNLTCQG